MCVFAGETGACYRLGVITSVITSRCAGGGGELCNKEKTMHDAGMAAHTGRWGIMCVYECV